MAYPLIYNKEQWAYLYIDWFIIRAGYRVRYFLGADWIASIPSSIEKRLVVRYQISIPKGLISSISYELNELN